MNNKRHSDSISEILKDYKPVEQGKVVAEESEDGWLVMLPDGSVEFLRSRRAVERHAKKYFEDNLPPQSIGIGTIEWRS